MYTRRRIRVYPAQTKPKEWPAYKYGGKKVLVASASHGMHWEVPTVYLIPGRWVNHLPGVRTHRLTTLPNVDTRKPNLRTDTKMLTGPRWVQGKVLFCLPVAPKCHQVGRSVMQKCDA